jgi:hypothetical protein
VEESVDHQHRWLRYQDEATKAWNHWCIDGDTQHHDEPCADADHRAGDHANDASSIADWDVFQSA